MERFGRDPEVACEVICRVRNGEPLKTCTEIVDLVA